MTTRTQQLSDQLEAESRLISMGVRSAPDPLQAALTSELWTRVMAAPKHWTRQQHLEFQRMLVAEMRSRGAL